MKRLSIAFIGLSTLDAVMTLLMVGSARATEFNPVVAPMLDNTALFLLFKIGFPIFLCAYLIWLEKHPISPKLRPMAALRVVTICFGAVCLWNIAVCCGLPIQL